MPNSTHLPVSGPDAGPDAGPDGGTDAPHVYDHRWPWRPHEYRAMAILALVPLGLGALGGSAAAGALSWFWYVGGALAAAATVGWLWHVGAQRKDRSAVRVEVHRETLTVRSRGALQTSTARHRQAVAVGYRRFGSDEAFIISDGTQAVRVPLRATVDPHVRQALDVALDRAARVDTEARELYARCEPTDRASR